MKRKEIFLDFTPLLDVTLIMLFFFIMFGNLELAEAKSDLDIQTEQMTQTQKQLDEQKMLLEEELAIIEGENPRREADLQALLEFNRGANIKLIMDAGTSGIEYRILQGEKIAGTTSTAESVPCILRDTLIDAGYTTEDTVICVFVLDGSQPGTAAAYRSVLKELHQFKKEYKHFYYSETDISLGKE